MCVNSPFFRGPLFPEILNLLQIRCGKSDKLGLPLHAGLKDLGERDVDLGKAQRVGSKLRQAFDARQILANWAGVDLTRINGLGLAASRITRPTIP